MSTFGEKLRWVVAVGRGKVGGTWRQTAIGMGPRPAVLPSPETLTA